MCLIRAECFSQVVRIDIILLRFVSSPVFFLARMDTPRDVGLSHQFPRDPDHNHYPGEARDGGQTLAQRLATLCQRCAAVSREVLL